jgi:non-ribosomal peptide synthetase component F
MVQGPESERLWSYWKQKLGGELTTLNVSSSIQRPEVMIARGECIPLAFEPALLTRLQQVAREYKTTGYSFLLAAFQVLLHHFTHQNDIIVGTSSSGRDNPRWANVVGYFVNLLPMRSDLSGNPTFAEHLVRVRDTVLTAIEHQAFPFPLLVERLRLRRNLKRSPVFQTFFNYLTDRAGELGPLAMGAVDCAVEFGSSTLRPCIIIPQQEGQSEIVLQLAEFQGQIVGNLNYNTDIVDRETAESMAVAFSNIVESVLLNPDTPIEELAHDAEEMCSERDEIVL